MRHKNIILFTLIILGLGLWWLTRPTATPPEKTAGGLSAPSKESAGTVKPSGVAAPLLPPTPKPAESAPLNPEAQPHVPDEAEMRVELSAIVKDVLARLKAGDSLSVWEDYVWPGDEGKETMFEQSLRLLNVMQTLSTQTPTRVKQEGGTGEFFIWDIVDPVTGKPSTFDFGRDLDGKWYLDMNVLYEWEREDRRGGN